MFRRLFILLVLIFLTEIVFIFRSEYTFRGINGILGYNPKEPIVIVIDVSTNRLSVFQKEKLIKTYPVASGKTSTPSPIGNWKVVTKGTWDHGFGGRWMGINVPWGKYGIHGTTLPGSIGMNSSHGCIRMRNIDVKELYNMTSLDTPVIIWGGPYGSFGSYFRKVKPGDIGSDVYEVQKILKMKGYFNGTPDGIYGDWMESIIYKYQRDNNLPLKNTVDLRFYSSLGLYLMD